VIEGEAYKRELLGGKKEPESVAGVIRAARLLKFKFGRVDVNIGKTLSPPPTQSSRLWLVHRNVCEVRMANGGVCTGDAISVKQFIANQYIRHQMRAEDARDEVAVRRLVSALSYR